MPKKEGRFRGKKSRMLKISGSAKMPLTNRKHFSMMKQIFETGCEKEKYPQSRDSREGVFGVNACHAAVKLTLELRTEGFLL